MSTTDDELDIRQTLNVLRRLAEPNGLITSDLEWAEAKLKAYANKAVVKQAENDLEAMQDGSSDYKWVLQNQKDEVQRLKGVK
jgi:hypothetical protein